MKAIWIAAANTPDHGRVYLPDYASIDEAGVGAKILSKARSEGFSGGLSERLDQLGWEVVRVSLQEVSP
jgi:hypothetical protein